MTKKKSTRFSGAPLKKSFGPLMKVIVRLSSNGLLNLELTAASFAADTEIPKENMWNRHVERNSKRCYKKEMQ